MTTHPRNPQSKFANERAEAVFVASGLSDEMRPVVKAEAHYIMNHVGLRYSDCVTSACRYVAQGSMASPTAQALYNRAMEVVK